MRIRRLLRQRSSALAALLAVVLSGALAVNDGRAAEADVFTVRGVDVDVTAETAAAAREQALADGHVAALRRLFERLLVREDLPRAPDLPASQVVPLVQDFGVDDERTSDVRYLASLTFRFKPDAVRALLRRSGLAHAETQSKPMVVVPVFGPAGQAQLWEESNPWREAWTLRPSGDGLVPLVVPLGDLADIAALDVDRALAGDRAAAAALARRYGGEDAVVAQAVLQGDPEAGAATLQVGTTRLGGRAQETALDSFTQQPEEDLAGLLARAADAVDRRIQQAWKQDNLLRPGAQRVLAVAVPHAGLSEWLEVKRRLRGVAAVQRSDVTTMSRGRSELRLTYAGSEAQLARALEQSDLALTPDPQGRGWQLRLAEAAAMAPAMGAPSMGAPPMEGPAGEAATGAPPESLPESLPEAMSAPLSDGGEPAGPASEAPATE